MHFHRHHIEAHPAPAAPAAPTRQLTAEQLRVLTTRCYGADVAATIDIERARRLFAGPEHHADGTVQRLSTPLWDNG